MKLGRHKGIEVNCEQCGILFFAVAKRVDQGLGKYCSRKCYNIWQRQNRKSSKWGKENAKTYPDKARGGYFVQWYDEDGKPKNSPWSKWAWEANFGEIPEGHKVEYKDGNKENIIINNLQLRRTRVGQKLLPKPPRKVYSLEYRNILSQRMIEKWKKGIFNIHKGSNNKNYKKSKSRHPKEFNEDLKNFIRERDNHLCQICGNDLIGKRQPVHHIDGIKSHNDPNNLILFCSSCHVKVHLITGNSSPTIMAFRSKLVE